MVANAKVRFVTLSQEFLHGAGSPIQDSQGITCDLKEDFIVRVLLLLVSLPELGLPKATEDSPLLQSHLNVAVLAGRLSKLDTMT